LRDDVVAGVTVAAYAIPVSLGYAGLAGLPPQVGIYGYLLGGLGYALLGSSRQLAIGPTAAISLMIAATVGAMAEGDAHRYAQIASLTGFTVAALCLIGWLLRLSELVKLISDSILVGFKAGAGLTIAMTQLPSLIGTAGGGRNFFERAVLFLGQLGETHYLVRPEGETDPSHARARLLLASSLNSRHMGAMPGSPLKRQRKQGVRLADGSIIAFPYMPRVADLPSDWRHFTTEQKIEHLIGLDRWEEILSWGPVTEDVPARSVRARPGAANSGDGRHPRRRIAGRACRIRAGRSAA
jgi:sulfate permease family protein